MISDVCKCRIKNVCGTVDKGYIENALKYANKYMPEPDKEIVSDIEVMAVIMHNLATELLGQLD